MRRVIQLLLLLFACQNIIGQDSLIVERPSFFEPASTLNKSRLRAINTSAAVSYTGLMLLLNEYWYKDFPKSKFHFYNDNSTWLQVDKVGHVWTAYREGLTMIKLYRWAGVEDKKAIWYGGLMGSVFQTSIEILDGYSEEWGASTGDLIANALGSGLVISQELLWQEQKFFFKFGPGYSSYDNYPDFVQHRVDNLYGTGLAERVLKDYNQQSYWLSFHPSVLGFGRQVPEWLNISVGYGAKDVFGGLKNVWTTNNEVFDVNATFPRIREYYLGLDVRLSKLKVRNEKLHRLFVLFDFIKFPLPAVCLQSDGKFVFKALSL